MTENTSLRMKYSCKFPNCKNAYYTGPCKNKHFYTFPKKPRINLLRKWKEICNIKDGVICDNFYVCEDHFLPADFINETRHRINYMVIPKHIVRLDKEERDILSDHSYFKLPNESTPNLDEEKSGAYLNVNEPRNNLDNNNITITDTDERSKEHNATASSNNIIRNNQLDSFSVSDKLFCKSFAQFETENLNVELNEDIQNVVCNPLSHSDSLYEFLLAPIECDDISIANESEGLSDPGLQIPTKSQMFKIHENVTAKLVQLRKLLCNEEGVMKILIILCKKGTFKVIYEDLGQISDSFIESEVRSSNEMQCDRNWSTQDKTAALFLYKHGSRLYKYLLMYFDLPSVTLLKMLFAKISYDTGLDPLALAVIKSELTKMNNLDKYCGLVFEEMSLDQGFYYDVNKQKIWGYQDLGHLGRSPLVVTHALVFMICGLNKPWKQVIAYYFIGHTAATKYLKNFIIEIIAQLQNIGLNVVSTICHQKPIYQNVLEELCKDTSEKSFYFLVNNKPVVTIFNVPHLLKNTLVAFFHSNIKLDEDTFAKYKYINKLFIIDKKKKFKTLPKLSEEHSIENIDVKLAAAQLSNTVAASIETLVLTNFLPAEAIYTAQFVSTVDSLFDSLNGYYSKSCEAKKYRCPLTDKSPHMEFWSQMIVQLDNWKVVDIELEMDGSTCFNFVEGWQCTIRSVMFLWDNMKKVGFKHLNLRPLNGESLDHLFCCIRKYSTKTHPTCFQFVDALKTCIVNDYSLPFENLSNCHNNDSIPLCNLMHFWIENNKDTSMNDFENCNSVGDCMPYLPEHFLKFNIDAQYIIECILNSIDFDELCEICKSNLFSSSTENNSSVYVKESDTSYLLSESLMAYLKDITDMLYKCLVKHSYMDFLEDRFKSVFLQRNTTKFCNNHVLETSILDKVLPLLIYKYVRENNNTLQIIYEKHSRS